MGVNRVAISGNLTRDAELKATTTGISVCRFSVAVNERVKNKATGDWEDRPNFVDCVLFGPRAEKICGYLRRGGKVAVEGRLRYSSWTHSDGTKRSRLEVVAEEVDLMSARPAGSQAPPPAEEPPMSFEQAAAYTGAKVVETPPAYSAPAPAAAAPEQPALYDEDIPF